MGFAFERVKWPTSECQRSSAVQALICAIAMYVCRTPERVGHSRKGLILRVSEKKFGFKPGSCVAAWVPSPGCQSLFWQLCVAQGLKWINTADVCGFAQTNLSFLEQLACSHLPPLFAVCCQQNAVVLPLGCFTWVGNQPTALCLAPSALKDWHISANTTALSVLRHDGRRRNPNPF